MRRAVEHSYSTTTVPDSHCYLDLLAENYLSNCYSMLIGRAFERWVALVIVWELFDDHRSIESADHKHRADSRSESDRTVTYRPPTGY